MNKELKIGDIVEVNIEHLYEPEWIDAIFIKHGNAGSIICVTGWYRNDYLDGLSFPTNRWEHDVWRIKKEIEYIPFTYEDKELLKGKWIKNKDSDLKSLFLIFSIHEESIEISGNEFMYVDLLHNYTFDDGTPCGKVKED